MKEDKKLMTVEEFKDKYNLDNNVPIRNFWQRTIEHINSSSSDDIFINIHKGPFTVSIKGQHLLNLFLNYLDKLDMIKYEEKQPYVFNFKRLKQIKFNECNINKLPFDELHKKLYEERIEEEYEIPTNI